MIDAKNWELFGNMFSAPLRLSCLAGGDIKPAEEDEQLGPKEAEIENEKEKEPQEYFI